jgi:hypothetical protein
MINWILEAIDENQIASMFYAVYYFACIVFIIIFVTRNKNKDW